jgi:MscS family membrane protein
VLRVMLAVFALLLTWVLRGVITRLVVQPFRRRAEKSKTLVDDQLIEVVEMPIQLLILAFGISLSANLLGIDRQSNAFITPLLSSLVIFAVASGAYRVVNILSFSSTRLRDLSGLRLEERLVPFVRVALRFLITVIAITIVLETWGYSVNALVAGLGIGTLGVSLAAQDTIANLFGFAAIVTDRPFIVGDHIAIADAEGKVEHVGLRSTALRAANQSRITIPNNKLANSIITNWTRLNKRYLNFTLGLGYATTPAQMRAFLAVLREMLKKNTKVEATSVEVFFTSFASVLNVQVSCYVFETDWSKYIAEVEAINLQTIEIATKLGLSLSK